MAIELKPITHGPHKGRWSWRITADKKPLDRGCWGRRAGVALDETAARKTAVRQLNWHMKDMRS